MCRSIAVAAATLWLLATSAAQAAAPELSTTDRLQDRRYVAAGDRAYVVGFENGRFPAQGWHIGGEMGGIWSQPLKLADGAWFGIDGSWLPPATRFTSGWGYTRMEFPTAGSLAVSRTDFAPDGVRAALLGLRLRNLGAARTVDVKVDVHSELLGHYPWAWTTPNATEANQADTGAYEAATGTLAFRDQGRVHPNAPEHDWAAVVRGDRAPSGGEAGPGHWGAQDPPQVCQDEGVPDEEKAVYCDESTAGKGTGGQLRYRIAIPANGTRTLWIAVAGSDRGPLAARRELQAALRDPAAALARKIATREREGRWTKVSLPADQPLADGIEWGKQNLLDSTQRADDLLVRDVDEGKAYPPPVGTVARARWIGAGFPDYPWIFATDGEYTAFAAVAVGQFAAIEDHARTLSDVSVLLNGSSGKVAHEIVADGSVYFGALDDPGNTDETAKFPSLVALIWRWTGDDRFRDDLYPFAKRNLEYVYRELDADADGWPEGLGNVERTGMGEEKLDNTVYTLRGLYDLADLADAKGDAATRAWALDRAGRLRTAFEAAWWMPAARQYADSLDDPGDVQVQQKHWIGVTPMEAELVVDRGVVPGIAARDHGTVALAERETDCYSGTRPYNRGLSHTGCGGGPTGAGERDIFTLNTSIMAVGEGNYGRLGPGQQERYTAANRELMLPAPDEQPGAMPEIAPSPPPRGRNIDRCSRCRSMVMQAWGNYGTVWPVVHQQLGVRPDLGRGRLAVMPQVPASGPVAGSRIRLGRGWVDVAAGHSGRSWFTAVRTHGRQVRRLRIGHTLPLGSEVRRVELDGRRVGYRFQETNRGLEISVHVRPGVHRLEIRTR
jgi:hypothetical protein